MIPHVFFEVPLSSYVEWLETRHPDDFNDNDMDSNEAPSFDEADGYAPDINHFKLSQFFDFADKMTAAFL